jgi:hypothetical protein
MRLNGDSTKIDLQTERAWGAFAFRLADEIDRDMTSDDGLAALQRACDLAALVEAGERGAVEAGQGNGAVEIRIIRGYVRIVVADPIDAIFTRAFEGEGAIEAAAEYARNGGGG